MKSSTPLSNFIAEFSKTVLKGQALKQNFASKSQTPAFSVTLKEKISKEATVAAKEQSDKSTSIIKNDEKTYATDLSNATDLWNYLQKPIEHKPTNDNEARIIKEIEAARKNITIEDLAHCRSCINSTYNGQEAILPMYTLFAPEWVIVRIAEGTFTPVEY